MSDLDAVLKCAAEAWQRRTCAESCPNAAELRVRCAVAEAERCGALWAVLSAPPSMWEWEKKALGLREMVARRVARAGGDGSWAPSTGQEKMLALQLHWLVDESVGGETEEGGRTHRAEDREEAEAMLSKLRLRALEALRKPPVCGAWLWAPESSPEDCASLVSAQVGALRACFKASPRDDEGWMARVLADAECAVWNTMERRIVESAARSRRCVGGQRDEEAASAARNFVFKMQSRERRDAEGGEEDDDEARTEVRVPVRRVAVPGDEDEGSEEEDNGELEEDNGELEEEESDEEEQARLYVLRSDCAARDETGRADDLLFANAAMWQTLTHVSGCVRASAVYPPHDFGPHAFQELGRDEEVTLEALHRLGGWDDGEFGPTHGFALRERASRWTVGEEGLGSRGGGGGGGGKGEGGGGGEGGGESEEGRQEAGEGGEDEHDEDDGDEAECGAASEVEAFVILPGGRGGFRGDFVRVWIERCVEWRVALAI